MSLNFPSNPQIDDQWTPDNGITYIYDGDKWVGHAPTLAPGSNSISNSGYVVQIDPAGNLVTPSYVFPSTIGHTGETLTWPASGNTLEWTTATGGGGAGSPGPMGPIGNTGTQGIQGPTGPQGNPASTGNFVFDADTITNPNGMIFVTNRGTLAIGTDMEVPGVPTHFHIAFEGSNVTPVYQDLFLGDDHNYVKIDSGSNGVTIGSSDRQSGSGQWHFGVDGTLYGPLMGGLKVAGYIESNKGSDLILTSGAPADYTLGIIAINPSGPTGVVTISLTSFPEAANIPNGAVFDVDGNPANRLIVTNSAAGNSGEWDLSLNGLFNVINGQGYNVIYPSTTLQNVSISNGNGRNFVFNGTDGSLTAPGNITAAGDIIVGAGFNGNESHFVVDGSNYWTSIQWKNMTQLQDPGNMPFECQAQLLRVFADNNTATQYCNISNPREELVAVTAIRPNATTLNGIMISTSDSKIPDAPYNDGVGTRHDFIFGGDGNLTTPGSINIDGTFANTVDGYLNLRGDTTGTTSRIHLRNMDSDPSSDVNIHLQVGTGAHTFEVFQLGAGNPTYPFSGGLRTNSTDYPILIQTNNNTSGSTSTWAFSASGELTLPNGGHLGPVGKGWTGLDGGFGQPVSLLSYYPSGMYSGCVTITPGNGVDISTYGDGTGQTGDWTFGNNGALSVNSVATVATTPSVSCTATMDTIIYTSVSNATTFKLLIKAEGYEGTPTAWDTQSSEMMIAYGFKNNNVVASVYGIIHTSVSPLATFTAQRNATTGRIEVLCRPTSLTNPVVVRTFATEIITSD